VTYAQFMLDVGDDAIPLLGDPLVRESQRPVSGLGEPGVPAPILLRMMKRAIEFDDQPGGMTAEIGDEAAHRELTPKVETVGLAQGAQPGPDPTLPEGGLVAQTPRELAVEGAAYLARANFVIRVAERAPHP
jgi:hypothetical protein